MITLRKDIFENDALRIAEWLEDEEIMAYLNEQKGMSSQIKELVFTYKLPVYNRIFNNRGLFYLICLDGKSIGYVKFIPKGTFHEIVIAIGEKSLWGKGYGKKALKKALEEAFFSLRYEKIDAKVRVENGRSYTMFQHLGFNGSRINDEMHHFSMDLNTFLKKAA